MRQNLWLSSMSLFACLGLGAVAGCDAPSSQAVDPREAALAACHMNDGTVDLNADLHACDPGSVKKTTICHIPPGNPANAHTICVGNAAVPAHVNNHGDSIGACMNETPCPPPPPTGTGGATGGGAAGAPGGGSTPDSGVTIVP